MKKGEVVYQPTALEKTLDVAKGAWTGGTEAVKSTLDTAKAVLNDPIGVTTNVVTDTAAEAWKWVSNPEKAWDELVAEAEADGRRIQHMIDTEDWNGIAKGVGNSIVSGITDRGIGKVVKLKSGSGGKGNSGKNEKSSNKGSGKSKKTFVDMMESAEAARYEAYWKQGAGSIQKVKENGKFVYKVMEGKQINTRQRLYTVPGERSIMDVKINEKTGETYMRETIFDKYGRRIGNNDFTDHGRPDIPTHTNPHYHANPATDPAQHGKGIPGLHPETPRRY
ncbi:hypothetical protein [Paenibacillus apiarius]|nr:hypothetical protein [Paenibacillus apiarius]MCY9556143.1 hypothetical protein [Paenibacillus apiarius]MCY9792396.1 hypothetical protein [Paenibacillus apiarius]MEC0122809.1 hypothetical protein [Paenibacillus apiarius]MEC0191706.1 hypothetical protein [Paenibacillus apiarius]